MYANLAHSVGNAVASNSKWSFLYQECAEVARVTGKTVVWIDEKQKRDAEKTQEFVVAQQQEQKQSC